MQLKKSIVNLAACSSLLFGMNVQSATFLPKPIETYYSCGEATVPCEAKAWNFGVDLLYAYQASGTNMYTTYRSTESFTDDPLNSFKRNQYRELKPNSWGIQLEASYHFGTGSDVRFNYVYLSRTTNNQLKDNKNILHSQYLPDWHSDGKTPSIARPIIPMGWNLIDEWSRTRFHAAHLEFGQTADFGDKINIRFHSGLGVISLRHHLTLEGSNTGDNRDYEIKAKNEMQSRFSGIGPRFGQNTRYEFDNGFSIYGNYAIGAYIGNLKSKTTLTMHAQKPEASAIKTHTIYRNSSQQAIVTGFEARLGIQYALPMHFGQMILDLAFNAGIYQNIIQQTNIENSVMSPSNLKDIDFTTRNHNWGFFGPSLGVKIIGMI